MGKLSIEDIFLIICVVALLGVTTYASFREHQTRGELKALQERYDVAQQELGALKQATKTQNDAVATLDQQRQVAEARGDAAWAAVRAQTSRLDTLYKGLAGKKAATCAEAMPALRQALEGAPL
jgi:hypothetical protein